MPRPTASAENRQLVVDFAMMCTKFTHNPTDLIARGGPFSVFSVVAQCCPWAVRIQNMPRDGVTEHECNKSVQNRGFKRARDRRGAAKTRSEDPEGSGLYVFSEVAWRDPDDMEDFWQLQGSWDILCCEHPTLSHSCSFEMLIDVLRVTISEWMPKAGFRNKKRKLLSASPELPLQEQPAARLVVDPRNPASLTAGAFPSDPINVPSLSQKRIRKPNPKVKTGNQDSTGPSSLSGSNTFTWDDSSSVVLDVWKCVEDKAENERAVGVTTLALDARWENEVLGVVECSEWWGEQRAESENRFEEAAFEDASDFIWTGLQKNRFTSALCGLSCAPLF